MAQTNVQVFSGDVEVASNINVSNIISSTNKSSNLFVTNDFGQIEMIAGPMQIDQSTDKKITNPPGLSANDAFGIATSVSGDTLVTGASGIDNSRGFAFVYTRDTPGDPTSGWSYYHPTTLLGPVGSSGDRFGSAISLDGDTVLIGASEANSDDGAAYVFTRNTLNDPTSAWTVRATLAGASGSNERFGATVSLQGDTMVIGAPETLTGLKGKAYVYRRNTPGDRTSGWTAVGTLTASDGVNGDAFGSGVAIDGDTIVIGAPGTADAYVFRRDTPGDTTSSWTQVTKLTHASIVQSNFFGQNNISLDGDLVLIGAAATQVGANANQGAAYIFRRDTPGVLTSGWTFVQVIFETTNGINSGSAGDVFGVSVSIDGDKLVVGARGADAAYVFKRDTPGDTTSTWTQDTNILVPFGGVTGGYYGFSVSIDNNTIAVGAPLTNSIVGVQYVYEDRISSIVALGGITATSFYGDGSALTGVFSPAVDTIAIGNGAGATSQGGNAIAIGYDAATTSQAASSVAIGIQAGKTSQGQNAVAIGVVAAETNQSLGSIAIGQFSGRFNQGPTGSPTISTDNIAIGGYAGYNAQGAQAPGGSLIGRSVAIGYRAGYNEQSSFSVGIGDRAGEINQGESCVSIGILACSENQGSRSIGIGQQAGSYNQGEDAVAIGYAAGYTQQSRYNVAIGKEAGAYNQGAEAIGIGRNAGATNQGAYATALGTFTAITGQGAYGIALGTGAGQYNQPANSFYVGATGTDRALRAGGGDAYVKYNSTNGEILYQSSDDRVKDGETFITGAVKTLSKLRPQTYFKRTKLDPNAPEQNWYTESGLMAQEVYYSAPELRHTVGVPAQAGDIDNYTPPPSDDPAQDPDYSMWGDGIATVDYMQMIPYLVKAVQEIVTELPRSKTTVSNTWGQNVTGLVVSADTNTHKTNTVPIVTLSNVYMDKQWYGVVSEHAPDSEDYDTLVDTKGDTRIWVTDVGGPLESGDLLTTSNIAPGYTQKQVDDLIRSSTVAKVTQDCDFTEPTQRVIRVPKRELSNVLYYRHDTTHEISLDTYLTRPLSSKRRVDETPIYFKEVDKESNVITGTYYYQGDTEVSEYTYVTLSEDERSIKYLNEIDVDTYESLSDEDKALFSAGTKKKYFFSEYSQSKTQIPQHDEEVFIEEMTDVLDENGQIVWEDTANTVPAYTLVDHGTYKAALVTCNLV
jgi:hypothetical protein